MSLMEKLDPVFFSGKNIWILKKNDGYSGNGVEIIKTLEELEYHLNNYVIGYPEKNVVNYSDKDDLTPAMKLKKES